MGSTVLCLRHGHAASVRACEHICAAVSSGTEPPVYRRLGVAFDDTSTGAYCACFACADQFELASEIRASRGAEAAECKFPESDPICTTCLKQRPSSPAAALAAMPGEQNSKPAQSSVRPIQVTAALLLLCINVGRQAVILTLHLLHGASFVVILARGSFAVIDAYLIYGIWMRDSRARNVYAGLFGLSMLLVLVLGGSFDTVDVVLGLLAICLLFSRPSIIWFATEL
jgi:hypothetical protein